MVGGLPLFRGSLLLAGDRDPADVRRQLARWKACILRIVQELDYIAKPEVTRLIEQMDRAMSTLCGLIRSQ